MVGEQGGTATSTRTGSLQSNHRSAKGHAAFRQAPKEGNTPRKDTAQQLIELQERIRVSASVARNILKLTRGKGTFVLT